MNALEAGAALRSSSADLGRVRIGRVVFALTLLAGAVAVALDIAAGTYLSVLYAGITGIVALLGVVLTTRRPDNRVSWVMALAALWWAIGALAHAYAAEALVTRPGSLPAGLSAAWLDNWAWLPGFALFLCALIVLVPDGRLASWRWWPVPAAVALGTVLASVRVSTESTFDLAGARVTNPLASTAPMVTAVGVTGLVLLMAGLAAALVAFVFRYRRSLGDERQQLRWVVVSLCVAVVLAVAGAFAWGTFPGAGVLPAAALLIVPAGIAVAILKYRLYELDVVVNRALVYTVLTVGVVVTYVAVVGLVGSYLSRSGGVLVSLVVTGVVAVSFQPARERVQRSVNRLMYGNRGDPYLAISVLSRTLAGSLQVESTLPAAVETIGRTLALEYVSVVTPAGSTEAEYGSPGHSDVLSVPLVHHDDVVGELRLSHRPGEQLRERDRRLIADLAPQVGAAVHAVALARELQAARQRLVGLREEERRRIRRDLHDGLGPALAGLTLTLEAVRNLADSDRGRANRLLESATGQVQTLVGDVRRLIYGLRPPALDELGLAASIRALAARDSTPGLDVTVEAPPTHVELPAAVEVGVYWIVQEALTNIRKHAHARACRIELEVELDAVRVQVADDGIGLEHASSGLGLNTMRERAAELGGVCEIGPAAAGGTLVSATLPCLRNQAGR